MRKFFAVAIICCLPLAASQAQLVGEGVFRSVPTSSYTGPGDVVSSASAFWSCTRAYNAAYASGGGAACDLVDASTGLATYTMHFLATGYANFAGAAASSACTVSCVVKKMYDQTGNGYNVTQATLADMPAMTFNGLGTCAVVGFNGTSDFLAGGSYTQAQEFSISSVVDQTGSGASQLILGDGTAAAVYEYFPSTSQISLNAGSLGTATSTQSIWQAITTIADGASSVIDVNGTSTTVSSGAGGFSSAAFSVGAFFSEFYLSGKIEEIGVWPSGINASLAALTTNQRAICGTF